MYRLTRLEVTGAYDSSLVYPTFGPIRAFFDQTKDLQEYSGYARIAPAAAEAQHVLGVITNANYLCVLSDYPIMVRVNGVSATQFTLRSNNVPATNVGSPLPDQCVFLMSGAVTSLYLAPITSAAQTANVKIFASGDPLNSYT